MTNHLFLFTIGPVQGFIAQARKTRDLYAGSQILSALVGEGIEAFKNSFNGGKIVFPYFPDNTEGSLPNRFIGKVIADSTDLKAKGCSIKKAVEEAWLRIAYDSFDELKEQDRLEGILKEKFEAQIKSLLDIHWVFQEIDDQCEFPYADAYEKIERMGGAIKNIRQFCQYNYNNGYGEKGQKCSIDGINNVLFYKKRNAQDKLPSLALDVQSFALNPGEGLSAVSFAKRFYNGKNITAFPSTSEVALMEDFKKLPPGFRKCYESLFNRDQKTILETCEEIANNDWLKKIKLTDINNGDWNDSFDAHYYFEENLNEKTIPNLTQRNLVKELHHIVKINSLLKTRYYAIVLFDGDNMGKWLSGEYNVRKDDLQDFHETLSKALGDFGKKASAYLSSKNGNGQTVYSGGDDFMGFVNIHHLFPVMEHFRKQFDEMVNQKIARFKKPEKDLTFSAGIVIAHYKTPFSEVIKKARDVEKSAKDLGGRNAFGIAVMKHSGEIQEAIYNWDSEGNSASGCSNWDALEQIYSGLEGENGNFSNKYIQNLSTEIAGLTGVEMNGFPSGRISKKLLEEAIPCEIKRLVARSWNKTGDLENIGILSNHVIHLWKKIPKEMGHHPRNFIHALHIADFMTRKIKE